MILGDPFQLKAVLGKLTAPIPPTTRMELLLKMVMMGNLLTALDPMTVLITLDYKMVLLITILHLLTMKYLTTHRQPMSAPHPRPMCHPPLPPVLIPPVAQHP